MQTISIMLPIGASSLALLLAAPAVFGAAMTAVGVYDETGQSNFVDFYVTTQTPSATATSGAADDLGGYKSSFQTGFTNNLGGVVNFDAAEFTDTGVEATYGVGATKVLNITTAFRNTAFGSSTEISGTREAIFRVGGADSGNGSISFGTITNGLVNERVVSFGLTFLGRSATDTVSGFATYDNASVSATLSRAIGNGSSDDTFFGFTAPTGRYIQSVAFTTTTTGGSPKTFDDLAFVTAVVPEPSSTALLAGSLGLLALHRRR